MCTRCRCRSTDSPTCTVDLQIYLAAGFSEDTRTLPVKDGYGSVFSQLLRAGVPRISHILVAGATMLSVLGLEFGSEFGT